MSRNRRAAIYCRISRDTEGKRLGVERQEHECRELAERLGWTVAEVLVDNDLSAYRGSKRPAYRQLVDAMHAGRIDAVLAWHPDRLTRQPRELEDLIDVLEATGTDVATVAAGTYDLTSAAGRMTARVIGATARYESEQKSARLKSKAAQLARDGKVGGGGTRPYGFATDRVTIVETEAAVIREAADLVRSGWSLRRVVRHLNERGYATVTGKPFSATVVRRMVTSPRVAGLRELRGEVVGEAEWPPILDRATWEDVRASLLDPARRKNHRMTRYLLAGIIESTEGTPMFSRPDASGNRRYLCLPVDGKPGSAIHADETEALVVEALLQRFDDVVLEIDGPDVDDHRAGDIAQVEAELEELAELRGRGEITLREWMAAREPLMARLDAARYVMTPTASSAVRDLLGRRGALRAAWPSLTFDQRQEIVRTCVEAVVVGPAVRGRNRFDPERISLR